VTVDIVMRFSYFSNMFYRILADMVIVLHLLWIAFVVLGFPLFLWLNSRLGRIIHLSSLAAMVAMQLIGAICPLTYLEEYLKSQGTSGGVYPGQFIIETIEGLIYVEDLTLKKITIATIAYLIVVISSFWFRPLPRKR
jgi:hypothetical protein